MTWGPLFMRYQCPACGKKFMHELDLIAELGSAFGQCPVCGAVAEFVKEAPRSAGDEEYEEID